MPGKVTESWVACFRVLAASIRISAAFWRSASESIKVLVFLFGGDRCRCCRIAQEMCDSVRIIAQHDLLSWIGAIEAVFFQREVAEQQHAQTDLDRIVL